MSRGPMILLVLLLAACSSLPPARPGRVELAASEQQRQHQLGGIREWSFAGRLAVSRDGQGGSGRLEWRQSGADFDIRLTAPVTGQGWQLVQQHGLARLSGIEGGDRMGPDAEALLLQATGWPLPLSAMADWLRGLRHGEGARMEFAADGLPSLLDEQGWIVEFRDWDASEPRRPSKLYARRDGASVRLVIDRWQVP